MINRALKLIRIFHEMKQKELAEKLKISRSHISEIESGKKKASYGLLQQYSTVFNIPISNLFFLSEFIEKSKQINWQIISPKMIFMLKLIQEKNNPSKTI